MNNIIHQTKPRYIIIHHVISPISTLNINYKNTCNIYQDHEKIILYKITDKIDINKLNLRLSEIKQGDATTNILANML